MADKMNNKNDKNLFGLIAEFKGPADLFHAVEKLTRDGIKGIDTHTPFPIHGMDKAMSLKDSRLGWIVAFMACVGFTVGIGLQGWAAVIAYPMIVSGKPLFSWQAFVPITFELTILFSAFGAVFGMLGLNKLPQLYHPLFAVEQFKQFSSHRFFLSVEKKDDDFNLNKIKSLLNQVGGQNIKEVSE